MIDLLSLLADEDAQRMPRVNAVRSSLQLFQLERHGETGLTKDWSPIFNLAGLKVELFTASRASSSNLDPARVTISTWTKRPFSSMVSCRTTVSSFPISLASRGYLERTRVANRGPSPDPKGALSGPYPPPEPTPEPAPGPSPDCSFSWPSPSGHPNHSPPPFTS